MADFVFNKSKGKIRYYAEQVGVANAALVVILVKATGLEADPTLRDYNDLATLFAGTTKEAVFTNYARKVITLAPTINQDNSNDWVDIGMGMANLTFATAGGAVNDNLGAVIFAFNPNTLSGTDANLVPLTKHDFVATTNGTDLILAVPSTGFARSA